jgi:hypothetical protein
LDTLVLNGSLGEPQEIWFSLPASTKISPLDQSKLTSHIMNYDMQPITDNLDKAFSMLTDPQKEERICLIQDIDKRYYLNTGKHINSKVFDACYDMPLEELRERLWNLTH